MNNEYYLLILIISYYTFTVFFYYTPLLRFMHRYLKNLINIINNFLFIYKIKLLHVR